MSATQPVSGRPSQVSIGKSPSTTSIVPTAQQEWNKFQEPRPYVTVSGLAVDIKGRFVLMHRSEKVRSARNCWSLPSGLHEVGLSMAEQFGQELREELNLTPIMAKHAMIGVYENIRPDGIHLPGWHWVIAVMAMRVESLDTLVNKEPEKHDIIDIVSVHQDWISGKQWAPRLGEFLAFNRATIRQSVFNLL